MNKLLAIAASAATFAGVLAVTPTTAGAQPSDHRYDRHDRRDHRYDRRDDRRWDRSRHEGWRYGRYYWRGRHYEHRAWTCRWRHGARVCFYRYW